MSEVSCPDCGEGFASAGGMAAHRRSRHELDAQVLAGVRSDLEGVGGPAGLRATALKLAGAMDDSMSARDLPSLSKELREVLAELGVGGDVEESEDVDVVDEIAARRAERLGQADTDVSGAS